ncbi:MAG: thrombospondin, partial [Planctomycetaceae bacterium]|nr:thrombospondin [Planctomycetaceae bacterium]
LTTPATNGIAVVNANGTFTYTPNANYNGADSFNYSITDADGDVSTALVAITVTLVDDVPVAVNDTLTVAEDSVLTAGDLATNDTPSGDGGNIWTLTTPATNGVAVVNPNGTFTYTPTANYNGPDSFTYTITDIDGDTSIATMAITVTSVNDVPVAVNDTLLVLEDSGTTNGDAALNDTPSADGGNVWTLTTPATGGVAVVNPNGTYTYTPNANFNGADSFTYTITDTDGSTSTATVAVTVTAVDDVPVAVADTLSVAEDSGTTSGNLATNDIPSGDGGNVWSLTTPAINGVAVVNANGTYTYTPNANYNGADSFSYTITDADGDTSTAIVAITVALVDDVPVAVNDTLTVAEDSGLTTGNLATNDTPSGDGGNVWTLTTIAANGVAVVNPNGTYSYTPNANFHGSDSFSYTVTDIDGDTSIATVAITVTSVNDSPVAVADALTVIEDSGSTTGDVALNDTPSADGGNVWSLTTPAANGTATVNAVGIFSYTPNANFNGSDSFSYTITDGDGSTSTAVVSVTVTAVDDVPVAVADTLTVAEDSGTTSGNLAGNDTPSGDGGNVWTLTTAATNGVAVVNPNGTFTYTPTANYNGPDSFTYTITDTDGDTSTAIVAIVVTAVNDSPVAVNDAVTVLEDSGVTTGNVAANDTPSADGGNVWSLTTGAASGVAVVGPTGTFSYTPNANFSGSDSFTYTITDIDGSTSTATVNVTVTGVNDAPVVVDGSGSAAQDGTFNGSLAPLGSDTEGDALTFSAVTQPLHGTLNLSPDGNFVYTPNPGFSGADLFTFKANDGQADSNIATFSLDVLDLFTLQLSPIPGTIATSVKAAVPLDNTALLINVSPTVNFANASITAGAIAGGDKHDRIFITDGSGGGGVIDARGRRILFNGSEVARVSGGRRGQDLQISFNGSATENAVDAVLQRISVKTSKHASRATRTFQISVSAGGETSSATIDANVA